jgi:23S rRNA (cytidine1920-2'-O)/16S rRNA (cytidine1409-2'-O)-methyltransferase
VIDVSFISLTLILPPACDLLAPDGVIIPLIKPQFELRKEDVAHGGVVRDPALHQRAVRRSARLSQLRARLQWSGCIPSPILGGEGNTEFLACLRVASA